MEAKPLLNHNTKSENRRVLEVYNYILENEFTDSDYWSFIGNEGIVNLLDKFDHLDWIELELDLTNWASNQLEIFANSLAKGDREKPSEFHSIAERSYLFAYIFTIIDKGLAFDLLDELEILSKGNKKPLKLLLEIKSIIDN